MRDRSDMGTGPGEPVEEGFPYVQSDAERFAELVGNMLAPIKRELESVHKSVDRACLAADQARDAAREAANVTLEWKAEANEIRKEIGAVSDRVRRLEERLGM